MCSALGALGPGEPMLQPDHLSKAINAGPLQRSQLGEKQLLLQLQGLQEELRPELQEVLQ